MVVLTPAREGSVHAYNSAKAHMQPLLNHINVGTGMFFDNRELAEIITIGDSLQWSTSMGKHPSRWHTESVDGYVTLGGTVVACRHQTVGGDA
jgi:hypothetical protein